VTGAASPRFLCGRAEICSFPGRGKPAHPKLLSPKVFAWRPHEETFGLVTQLRRAAVSVVANLVEGAGRLNRAERQCAGIARGSAAEVSYHLLLARDLGYIAGDDSDKLREDYSRVGQMLTRLTPTLR
jgi:four helix bundle protein